jgi:hypothetical protein
VDGIDLSKREIILCPSHGKKNSLFLFPEGRTHSSAEQHAAREPQFGYVAPSPTCTICLSSYSIGICPWLKRPECESLKARLKGVEFAFYFYDIVLRRQNEISFS